MNNILKQIDIDLYSTTSYEVIKAQQGDKNSRIIELTMYDKGEPYMPSGNITFRFAGHRGDGSSFLKEQEDCITKDGNRISIKLLEDILYYDGIIEAKLVMYEGMGTSNEKILSTIPFKISCIKNPCDENDITPGEYSIVTDLISKVENFSSSAQGYVDQSKMYAESAQRSSDNADDKSSDAAASADLAETYKNSTYNYMSNAANSASNASNSNINASQSATDASQSALLAQSYAVGTGNARPNEKNENAKKYYEDTKSIKDSLDGALRPMRTVSFSALPALANVSIGDMYNISDVFTTTSDFEEGSGHNMPAGSNVYKTANGKWDVLAGSTVAGVKGSAEECFRTGNVEITKADIGLGNVDNTADADKRVSYAAIASSAERAAKDGDGKVISDTYARCDTISNTDFNNFKTPGIYRVLGTSRMTNPPFNSENGWSLIVTGSTDNTHGGVVMHQTAIPYNSNDVYVRSYYGGGWTSWTHLLSTDGGTILGNLRVQAKGESNFGGVINFGDGDYVHISEPTDDNMEIKAKNVNFVITGNLTLNNKKILTIDQIYPIGSIYMSVNSANPGTLFGGTWAAWGKGRVPVGVDTSDTDFNYAEKTDGEKKHKLTVSEMPSHSHTTTATTATTTSNGAHKHELNFNRDATHSGNGQRIVSTGTESSNAFVNSDGEHTHSVTIPSLSTNSSGSDNPLHNNMQPYITCYMWKRTA